MPSIILPAARLIGLTLCLPLFFLGLNLFILRASAPQTTSTTVMTVTTTDDELNSDGDCALREAILAANLDQAVDACPAGRGVDTILLPSAGASGSSYILTRLGVEDANQSGDLDVRASLTISGQGTPGPTITSDGLVEERIFHIMGSGALVAMQNITIANGYEGANVGGGILLASGAALHLTNVAVIENVSERDGGGIYSRGGLTLDNVVVQDNATGEGRYGGGIYHDGNALALVDVSISNNTAGFGAGLSLHGGNAWISRSLISANDADQDGGGIYNNLPLVLKNSTVAENSAIANGGGLYNSGSASLFNVTVANNNSSESSGGGLYNDIAGGQITLQNSIIADNQAASLLSDGDCTGVIHSQGYNLIEGPTGCTLTGVLTGNQTGISPLLGPLQNNGGNTDTLALLPTSPAIDAGDPNGCLDEKGSLLPGDQRGLARPVAGNAGNLARCDLGAYEAASHLPPTATATSTATPPPTNTATPTPTNTATSLPPGPATATSTATPTPTTTGETPTPATIVPTVTTLPKEGNILPEGGSLYYNGPDGHSVLIHAPTAAVDEAITLVYSAIAPPGSGPNDWHYAGQSFTLLAYRNSLPLTNFVFQKPITLTLTYTASDVITRDEEQLLLYTYDAQSRSWSSTDLTVSQRESVKRQVVVTLRQLGQFATFAPTKITQRYYLPVVWSQGFTPALAR